MAKKLPRGIRENNPGNIRKSKDKWQGLAKNQPDKEFFTFEDPTYGIRAIARILIKYYDDYNIKSVRYAIRKWAPPVENNTDAYINAVAEHMGVKPGQELDFHKFSVLYPLVEAIIQHENGSQPYSEAQIVKGLMLAGVEKEKKKPVVATTQVKGAAAVGGLTAVNLMAEHVEKVAPVASSLESLAATAPYILGIIVVGILGYMIYDQFKKRKEGLL